MKVLISAAMAALLAAAAPAWADRGHGRHGHVVHHHVYHVPPGHVKHAHKHWKPRPVVRYYSPVYVYPAYPVYVAPAPRPAPGVHVVLPDVVIRF
jgi:hypothetical protein